MNMRLLYVALAAFTLLTLEGCRHQCRRPYQSTCPPRCAPACPTCPGGPGGLAAPLPPGGAVAPPAATFAPPAPPAPSGNVDVRSFSAPAAPPSWQPPQGGARLAPETSSAEPPVAPGNVRLQPPVVTETPPAQTPKPAVTEERLLPSPSLPVGIPQFASAKERVTSGLRPTALDGFEWLQANGYRAALHVRGPRDGDNADRKVVEKYGMKYLSIEMTPQTLPQALEEFNRVVGDTSLQPLFVYDRDGMLAGSLWYLHFRTVDRLNDEAARRKAAALGLKEDATGEAGTLWVAIQEYLRKNMK